MDHEDHSEDRKDHSRTEVPVEKVEDLVLAPMAVAATEILVDLAEKEDSLVHRDQDHDPREDRFRDNRRINSPLFSFLLEFSCQL